MNPAKCDEHDYIHFVIAAQRAFSCAEAARCQPHDSDAPSHDAFTRLLTRQPPDTEALWTETRGLVNLNGGVLVLDDSTLDKPYARRIELVTRHRSGKHHRVVMGINLISMVWTDGRAIIPCDFRVYDQDELQPEPHHHCQRCGSGLGFQAQREGMGGGGGGEEWVFGYNAHVVADANYGIPLAVAVTLGNQSDTNYLTPLVEETGQRPDVVIADRGYDSAPNNKWLHER